ncbi:hypothetical protein [Paenibacillus sp. NPDC058177]|uniref:hypothetical protein n=1 Tax=Paenibacillus sp. NPDC058177 TaxID=3346369 RepID=UPI0036DB50DC
MSDLNFSKEETKRLSELLKYAYDAIDYWFEGCDVDDTTFNENISKKTECEYFINKIDKQE